MSLKKIEIFGFKSFADRTEILFEPGVTCIVGPNGCGKSNISDATRWVLGERSAKLLRGTKMEDVIFNGTDFRKPFGFAEVHLTFDNRGKILPIEYEEVVLSRKIYRSGEGEYFINKTPCRYKDIQDLILDTGIGSNSYSMIEQGRIDYILSADPEERRFLIEEAAGISKFKSKKEEAIKKLERTEENLLRLGDIVSEVEKNIKYAERQAKRAEKYKEQFDELKKLEIKKALWELSNLETGHRSLEEKKTDFADEQRRVETDLTDAEQIYRESLAHIQTLESEFSSGEFKKVEMASKINSLREKIYFNLERIGSLKNQKGEAENEIAKSSERIKKLEQEIKRQELEIATEENELLKGETDLGKSLEKIDAEKGTFKQKKEVLESLREQQMALSKLRVDQHNEKVSLESRSASIKAHGQHLSKELVSLEQEKANAESQAGAGREKEEALQSQKTVLEETLGVVDENLRMKEMELESVRTRILQAEGRKKEIDAEIQMTLGEGIGKNIKEIFRKIDDLRKNSATKLFGAARFLKEAIRAKQGSEVWFEKLTAVWSGDVLVLDRWEALSDLKTLADESALLPLVSLIKGTQSAENPLPVEWKGVPLVPLSEHLEPLPEIPRDLLNIFSHIFVSSLEARELFSLGIEAMVKNRQILTEDGILIGPGSLVTFPKARAGQGQPETVLRGLKQESELVSEQRAEFEDRARRIKREKEEMEEDRKKVQEELSGIRAETESEGKLKNSLTENVSRLNQKIELVQKELEDSRNEISELDQLISEHDLKVRELDGQEKAMEQALHQSLLSEREFSDYLESEKLKQVRLETEVMSLRGRLDLIREALKQSQSAFQEETNRIGQRTKNINDGEQLISQLISDNLTHNQEIETLMKNQSETELDTRRIKENLQAERKQSQEFETKVKELRETFGKLRDELHRLDMTEAETKFSRSSLIERIRQSYKVDLDKEPRERVDVSEENPEEVDVRIRHLKEKLESYGAVNLLAVEEYSELKTRYDFLVTQKTDLTNARESLLNAIRKINRTTRKLFQETFEQVQIAFQELFTTLFSGGEAKLALLDEENPLESGIEIMVRPPGKKLQHISLLSGGEKALTAIALLFALFKIKPSPFCMLDEVDAPLDEANIDRFLNVVRSFLKSTQFVIVTHNRKTISMGDVLYGVTMEETGVSKIVSVKVSGREDAGELISPANVEK